MAVAVAIKETGAVRELERASLDTPIGSLTIEASKRGLRQVYLDRQGEKERAAEPAPDSVLARAVEQLEEYFAGNRHEFDLAFDLEATEFERRIRDACVSIDYGSTISYGELAELGGHPRAARAAGNVMRNNPLMLVIPCHRVIGADGSLRGYGGLGAGLSVKRWLLDFESGV